MQESLFRLWLVASIGLLRLKQAWMKRQCESLTKEIIWLKELKGEYSLGSWWLRDFCGKPPSWYERPVPQNVNHSTVSMLTVLGGRFAGVDLQFRRPAPNFWAGCWRAELFTSKNQREDYRLAASAATADAAVKLLWDAVKATDRKLNT